MKTSGSIKFIIKFGKGRVEFGDSSRAKRDGRYKLGSGKVDVEREVRNNEVIKEKNYQKMSKFKKSIRF